MRKVLILSALCSLSLVQTAPELVISVGHDGMPDRAAFVGNYLVTAETSNLAIIDLTTGLTVDHLPQGALVMAVEGSRAGDLVAVATCNHAVELWNVDSRTLVRRFGGMQECPESVFFSPDGSLLATGLYECCPRRNGLRVWDVRTGALVRELARGSGVRHVVFSGNGGWVAAVDDDGKATVFDWPSGRPLRTYEGLAGAGYSSSAAIASPDGRYFAWNGRGLRVWDLTSGNEIQLPDARLSHIRDEPPGGPVREWDEMTVDAEAAEFLDDGRLAYVDSTQMILMRLPDGPREVISAPWYELHKWLKIRRDGRLLAGSRDTRTVVWEPPGKEVRELTAPALTSPVSLQWSTAGVVAWADLWSGMRAWDARSGKPIDLHRPFESAARLDIRRDGARAVVAGSSTVYVVDMASDRVVATRKAEPGLYAGIAFSPDGSWIAFTSSDSFDLFDGKLRRVGRISALEKYSSVDRAAFSPDGRWIAAGIGGPHTALRVWPRSGAPVTLDAADVTYGQQPPAFSSDSRRLASFTKGEWLTIWSTGSWHVERTWKLPGNGEALAFAPDGSRLAVAGDGEAAIWDADTGTKLVAFSTPGSTRMTEIAWSPDARRVATSADDGVLRFWSSSDGRLLASLYMLDSSNDWLLVTPDGRLDGSERALAQIVAWRAGNAVTRTASLTQQHRVRGLWRSLSLQLP